MSIFSNFSQRPFRFCRCDACGLTFVADPRTDFDVLYDRDYYAGKGADSFVNYLDEMSDPHTIRNYEWRGIFRAVTTLTGTTQLRWLDYGCGLGGLVRYARARNVDAWGYDQGFSSAWMAKHKVPQLDAKQLADNAGTFDVVTAIEVIEHVREPVTMMRDVAKLLKPGGLVFLTTANAEPHLGRFGKWAYVHPEVHIAYFQPRTLREVYRRAGLAPYAAGFLPGHEDVIRYKILQTLHVTSQNRLERLVPWRLAGQLVDRRYQLSAQPVARLRG
jgi:2-polyprenyl-3-methyl-5-hydroxy-6-metoxy-1,4-benzoquinol methylase